MKFGLIVIAIFLEKVRSAETVFDDTIDGLGAMFRSVAVTVNPDTSHGSAPSPSH
jgi:hypothetical protein